MQISWCHSLAQKAPISSQSQRPSSDLQEPIQSSSWPSCLPISSPALPPVTCLLTGSSPATPASSLLFEHRRQWAHPPLSLLLEHPVPQLFMWPSPSTPPIPAVRSSLTSPLKTKAHHTLSTLSFPMSLLHLTFLYRLYHHLTCYVFYLSILVIVRIASPQLQEGQEFLSVWLTIRDSMLWIVPGT